MSKKLLDTFAIAGMALIVAVFVVVVMCAQQAHGQAASQPVVVAPVAASGAWGWFLANSGWLVPLAITVLSSLATGLSDYPKAGGLVRVLRVVAGCLSVVQFRNAPGSLKAPLTPPAKVS